MKLLKELINKRIEIGNQSELNHNYLPYIWHFYQVYSICLAIVGAEDNEYKKKNILISKLISSSKNKFDFKIYSKIQSYMKKDLEVINIAVDLIQEKSGGVDYLGDYYVPGCIAISTHD